MNLRLAYTTRRLNVKFTPRGKGDEVFQNGFIRWHGRTVSGYVFDGVVEKVFYPKGQNESLVYEEEAA